LHKLTQKVVKVSKKGDKTVKVSKVHENSLANLNKFTAERQPERRGTPKGAKRGLYTKTLQKMAQELGNAVGMNANVSYINSEGDEVVFNIKIDQSSSKKKDRKTLMELVILRQLHEAISGDAKDANAAAKLVTGLFASGQPKDDKTNQSILIQVNAGVLPKPRRMETAAEVLPIEALEAPIEAPPIEALG